VLVGAGSLWPLPYHNLDTKELKLLMQKVVFGILEKKSSLSIWTLVLQLAKG
jgi:hypothetical protein